MAAVALVACDNDVDAPYGIPGTDANPLGTHIKGGTGAGTIEDPYNVISILNVASQLEAGDQTDDYCYIYQGALVFNAYSISNGGRADLYSPLLNFSNHTTPSVSFDLCYKRYNNNSNDKLQIMVSTDCGSTWTTVFDKSGADLATGANTTSNYVADAYATQSIDLSQFAGQEKVIVKFAFTSNYGNNIWVDNINISNQPAGIEENEDNSIAIFPNPAKDVLNITSEKAINQIDVYDVNGKLVKSYTNVNNTINVKDLATGVYMLNITTEDGQVSKKIVKE